VTRFSIETCSGCTRTCATCMRQTYPDRDRIHAWLGKGERMPLPVIQRVLTELWDMGYRDAVGLNQYNEPLMDNRLPEIARFAQSLGFHRVTIITNGDLLTPGLAKELDGAITHITVSGYDNTAPTEEMYGWFEKTHISFSGGQHRLSHYSPSPALKGAIERFRLQPCYRHSRNLIVNHQGDCLMCCEEIVSEFGIGNVYRQPLADIWNGRRRQQIIRDLSKPGGRLKHPHCSICPVGRDLKRRLKVANQSTTCECFHV
jgi:radical SAM protein with 4Fe4S-binding SPASM domain